jgi:recombinational DNA repair protein RecT
MNEVTVIKTQNIITEFCSKSESWKLFMQQFPPQLQKQIAFDLFGYIQRNSEVVSGLNPDEFMAQVIIGYSKGYSLQDGDMYVLPFNGKATLVEGYKGVVRLANESGIFKYFDATPVIKDSIKSFDYRRGVPIFDEAYIPTGKEQTIGYYAYSETKDGSIREIYHPNEYFIDFAKRKSLMCKKAGKLTGVWEADFPAMCKKTILKELGALAPRKAQLNEKEKPFFNVIDAETGEIYDGDTDEPPMLPPEATPDPVPPSAPKRDKSDIPPPPPPTEEDYGGNGADDEEKDLCEECGAEVTAAVAKYSNKKFNRTLCFSCQKKQ